MKTEYEKAVTLLEEVIRAHADPDDMNYNECDKPEQECMWCANAKEWIETNKPGK